MLHNKANVTMNKDAVEYNEQEFKNRLTSIIKNMFNSENELAEYINAPQNTINRWKNQKQIPSVFYLAKLSIITELSLNYIVLGIERKKSYSSGLVSQNNNYESTARLSENVNRKITNPTNANIVFNESKEKEYRNRLTRILETSFSTNIEAAKVLGYNSQSIGYWKKHKKEITIQILVKISLATGYTLDYIVFGKHPTYYDWVEINVPVVN